MAAALNSTIIKDVVLLRIASSGRKGVASDGVRRDVQPLVAHRLKPAEWRRQLDRLLEALKTEGAIGRAGAQQRWVATKAGLARAVRILGVRSGHLPAWSEIRDAHLVCKALGLASGKATHRARVATASGLRRAILETAFGLTLPPRAGAAAIRNALALKALEQAFGPDLAHMLDARATVPGRAGRAIAAQLAKKRGRAAFATDSALVAALAAERAGAAGSDVRALRLALLRDYVSRAATAPPSRRQLGRSAAAPTPRQERPDLARFAGAVAAAARQRARGWSGDRKAYISEVWQAIRKSHPEWGLSETDFKDMLAAAHRAGHLELANADLRDRGNVHEVEASAVRYKNTEWHLIRIGD